MKEKTIFDDLQELGKRLLKPKTGKDDFYRMTEREMQRQKKKV